MGFLSKFSMPKSFFSKKTYELPETPHIPILGQVSTYKTLATFDLKVDKPKYTGDIPEATIKFYDDFE